jgi:hypothetical protein
LKASAEGHAQAHQSPIPFFQRNRGHTHLTPDVRTGCTAGGRSERRDHHPGAWDDGEGVLCFQGSMGKCPEMLTKLDMHQKFSDFNHKSILAALEIAHFGTEICATTSSMFTKHFGRKPKISLVEQCTYVLYPQGGLPT